MSKDSSPITKWYAKPITETVRMVLADGTYPTENTDRWEQFKEDVDGDRLLAMLETPTCDIELEMWSTDGDDFDESPDKEDKRINLALPVLTRGTDSDDTWEITGYSDADINVDFTSPTWEQDLKDEMWEALCKYAKDCNLSLTEPNPHAC